jgi:hypothetical protein
MGFEVLTLTEPSYNQTKLFKIMEKWTPLNYYNGGLFKKSLRIPRVKKV